MISQQQSFGLYTGRACYYCRARESSALILRPWKPAAKWILLCDACVPRYRMSILRRWYCGIVRWWKMRAHKPKENANGYLTSKTHKRATDPRAN